MIRYASITFEDKVLDLGCGYEVVRSTRRS
jgi:hypothetical protein